MVAVVAGSAAKLAVKMVNENMDSMIANFMDLNLLEVSAACVI
jgi:hypothetical protein